MAVEIFNSNSLKITRIANGHYVFAVEDGYLTLVINANTFLELTKSLAAESAHIRSDRARSFTMKDLERVALVVTENTSKDICRICDKTKDSVSTRNVGHNEFIDVCDDCWPGLRANMRIK